MTATTSTGQLEWIDGRWHLDGRAIHAGNCLEVRWPDGTWEAVRIESGDCGRKLFANFDYHGLGLSVRIAMTSERDVDLRWPAR